MPLTAGTISNTLVDVCVGLLICRSTDFCDCDCIIKLYRSVVEIKSKRSDYRYGLIKWLLVFSVMKGVSKSL